MRVCLNARACHCTQPRARLFRDSGAEWGWPPRNLREAHLVMHSPELGIGADVGTLSLFTNVNNALEKRDSCAAAAKY